MEEFKNEINVAILHIECYLRYLIIGRYEAAEQYVPVITGKLNKIIPNIIRTYGEDEITDQRNSALWVLMLKRMIGAMNTDDDFMKIDTFDDMAELLKNYLGSMETENV